MSDPVPSTPAFAGDLPSRVDTVVVGGGIAGASAAYHLAEAGVRTLLIERGRVGSGATAAALGVLSPPMRQPFHETVRFRGEDVARKIWTFALRSVSGLGELLERRGEADEAGLDLSGGHVLAEAHTARAVEASYGALHGAGFPVSWLSAEEARALTGGRGFTGGYRIDGGGALSPGPTAACLARAAADTGADVREGVEVRAVRRSAAGIECETDAGTVRCEMVVYATHVDARRFSDFLGDEIVPIRGQGMVASPGQLRFRGSFATHWKMNVWRSDAGGRLYVGGWRHDAWDRSYWKMRPAVDDALQEKLRGWFESAFPGSAPLSVERRWSGIFGWTADYLPLVGPLPGRVGELVISGFSGGGLPLAFGSGRAIAAIVADLEPPPGVELLNPRRFT